MTVVGEKRTGKEIHTRDSSGGIILRATRLDEQRWNIWRSDIQKWVATPELETRVWSDVNNNYSPKCKVSWAGNKFSILVEGGNSQTYDYLDYFSDDPHEGEWWRATWNAEESQFHSECFKVVHA